MVLGKNKKTEIRDKITSISPKIDMNCNYSIYNIQYKSEPMWGIFNEIHLNVYLPFRVLNNFISWN